MVPTRVSPPIPSPPASLTSLHHQQVFTTLFTRFTSTKVHILRTKELLSPLPHTPLALRHQQQDLQRARSSMHEVDTDDLSDGARYRHTAVC